MQCRLCASLVGTETQKEDSCAAFHSTAPPDEERHREGAVNGLTRRLRSSEHHIQKWQRLRATCCVSCVETVKWTPWNPEKPALVCHQLEPQHAAMPWLVKGVSAQHDQLGPSRVYPLGMPLLHMASRRREMLNKIQKRNKWMGCFVGKRQQLPRTFTLLFTGLFLEPVEFWSWSLRM